MQPELLFFLHLQKLFAENFVQAGAEVQNVYVGNLANLNIYVATFTWPKKFGAILRDPRKDDSRLCATYYYLSRT